MIRRLELHLYCAELVRPRRSPLHAGICNGELSRLQCREPGNLICLRWSAEAPQPQDMARTPQFDDEAAGAACIIRLKSCDWSLPGSESHKDSSELSGA